MVKGRHVIDTIHTNSENKHCTYSLREWRREGKEREKKNITSSIVRIVLSRKALLLSLPSSGTGGLSSS